MKPGLRPALVMLQSKTHEHAILVAAGKGTRMGAGVDKLFLEVAGPPGRGAHMAAVRRRRLHWRNHPGRARGRQQLLRGAGGESSIFQKPFRIVTGGGERQDSVWNGLEALLGDGGGGGHSRRGRGLA